MKKTSLWAQIALSMTMASCGDGVGDVTTGNGPSATPTPAPTATPALPVATPTPVSGTVACKLPALPNCDATCCSNGGSVIFRGEIEQAEAELTVLQPALFRSNGDVRDNFEYVAALAKYIQAKYNGTICAEALGHDELRIKGDQNISQHVDVLISDVSPWVGGAYTCRPASF